MSDERYLSLAEVSCFDNDGDGSEGEQKAQPDDAGKAGDDSQKADKAADGGSKPDDKGDDVKGRLFTQDDVNRIVEERLARDRKAREERYRDLESRYSQLLENQNLSEEERNKLEESLEDVRKQLRSKDQQAAHERKQLLTRFEQQLSESHKAAEVWENRFRESSINRALQDAAVANDAYNSSQVVGLLRPMTKLVEDVDETTGKATGRFKTVVDLPDRDEQGHEVMTQGSPSEIVKRMKELGDYANLFKSNVVSGLGANSATGGLTSGVSGPIDIRNLTPEQYKKIREENPELLGLRKRRK
jgi:hypothetical protein